MSISVCSGFHFARALVVGNTIGLGSGLGCSKSSDIWFDPLVWHCDKWDYHISAWAMAF